MTPKTPTRYCICADCDSTSFMDRHGRCVHCQSLATMIIRPHVRPQAPVPVPIRPLTERQPMVYNGDQLKIAFEDLAADIGTYSEITELEKLWRK